MTECVEDTGPRERSGKANAEDPAPYYRCHVFCCMNERPPGHELGCCKEKGAVRLRNYLKARVKELGLQELRINQSGCLDRCELGPVMVIYPEGVWYHYRSIEDAEEILQTHLVGGGRVERLMLQPDAEAPPVEEGRADSR